MALFPGNELTQKSFDQPNSILREQVVQEVSAVARERKPKHSSDYSTFADLIAAGGDVYVENGTYDLTGPVTSSNTINKIDFGPEVVLRATGTWAANAFMLRIQQKQRPVIEGRNVLFDLNETANRAVLIDGTSGDKLIDPVVRNVRAANRATPGTDGYYAFGFKHTKGAIIDGMHVDGYGDGVTSGAYEVYGLFFDESSGFRVYNYHCESGYIGIDIGTNNSDGVIVAPRLENLVDNGVYILSNNGDVRVVEPYIYNAEEGVVILSPSCGVFGGSIKSCTNKAITLRRANYGKVHGVTFSGNVQDIGDNDQYASYHLDVGGNIFLPGSGTGDRVALNRSNYGRFHDNQWDENLCTGYQLRLNARVTGVSDTDGGNWNSVYHNSFRSAGKVATAAMRFGATQWNRADFNDIIEHAIGHDFFTVSGVLPVNNVVTYPRYGNVTTPVNKSASVVVTEVNYV